MIAAIVVLSILLGGTIAAAIAIGYRAGTVRGDLTVAQNAADTAIEAALAAESYAEERVRRKDAVIATYKAKLRKARNELQNDPDPIVRGSAALDSILGLLSEMSDEDDPDPDSDD